MTVTYNSSYTITPVGALILPEADTSPLETALLNGNAAYQLHKPTLVTAVLTCNTALTRQSSFRIPVAPSADDLDYTFVVVVRTGAGTTSITWSIEWQNNGGGWTTIDSGTESAGASTVVTITGTGAIDASADEIRVQLQRGSDAYTPDSVTVYPTGSDAPSARTASGFWPYDDALFTDGQQAINTEFVNRGLRNVKRIVDDRQQALLSFVQEDDTDVSYVRYDMGAAAGSETQYVDVGEGIAPVPYAKQGMTVTVFALASVSAGSTSDLVRVSAGGPAALLNANGNVQSATIAANVINPGTEQASIRFRIQAKRTSGNEMYLHAVTACATPYVDTTVDLIETADAPASTSLLSAALRSVEMLAMRPYYQPALCYEGNTSGLDTRRFSVVVPPAAQFGRACLYRSQHVSGSIQSDSTIAATTTSGVPASPGAAIVTVDTPTVGTESYYDLGGGAGYPMAVWSSGDNLLSTPPGSTQDRGLELVEATAPSVEVVEVYLTTGFAMHYARLRPMADWDQI